MTPYPLTMQLGMKRFNGHVFLAPGRLYFICSKMGGAWAAAIGQGLGGLVGAAIAAAATPGAGQAPSVIDEAQLAQAVAQQPGSMIMEAGKIESKLGVRRACRPARARGRGSPSRSRRC